MDKADVQEYLRARLAEPLVVESVKRSFPGASRETWLVRCEPRAGAASGYVVRVEPPEGAGCPGELKNEFEVYRRLYSSEVPVAEPLWYAEGIEFAAGRPHMVRRMVEGSSTVAGLFNEDADAPARRQRVAFECVEKLALVHRLDWKAYGFQELLPSPPSAADSFKTELSIWSRYWAERKPFNSPVLEETIAWLGECVPADTPRISLVKGNNGLGEEIWQGEKIVAMSDWELACLGDGISDLFWSQGTVRLVGFEEVLRHYEEAMGQKVSMERLAFANLFALVKQIISSRAFWYLRCHQRRTNKPYAFAALCWGLETEHRLARCLGRPMDEAWEIINGGEKDMYGHLARSNQ